MPNKISFTEFKEKFYEKYKDKFEILSTEEDYKNASSILKFKCNECGFIFYKKAKIQLSNGVCQECNKVDRYKYIWKAIQKHGYKFDYRELNYIDNKTNIIVGCEKHGFFDVNPCFHLSNKYGGCKDCNPNSTKYKKKHKEIRKTKFNTELMVNRVKEIHGDNISLDNVVYKSSVEEITAHCNIHNIDFKTTFHDLLNGHACKLCGIEKSSNKRTKDVNEIIEICNKAHNNKYDYSEINYTSINNFIYPICKKHGKFKVNCYNHMFYHCGCPKCSNRKHYAEVLFYEFIKEHYKDAIYNYHNPKILGRLSIDVFIPSINVGIEFQGGQHFKPVKWFGGEKTYMKIIERDSKKYNICKENNIKLFYYTEYKIPNNFNLYKIYTNKEILLSEINKAEKV